MSDTVPNGNENASIRLENLVGRDRKVIQVYKTETRPESEDETIKISECSGDLDSYLFGTRLNHNHALHTIIMKCLSFTSRSKPRDLPLFFEAVAAASRIRQIALEAIHRGIKIRWYEYNDNSEASGGMNGFLTPVNSNEIRPRYLEQSKLSALFYLSLTISNKESLVFNTPGQAKDPGILFTADSDLSFPQSINWHDGMIVTAPHHGSEHNSNVYHRFINTNGQCSINWVRSDGRFRSRPGTTFLSLNGSRWCTLCRNHAKPKQSVRFVRRGKVWVPIATRKCRCK